MPNTLHQCKAHSSMWGTLMLTPITVGKLWPSIPKEIYVSQPCTTVPTVYWMRVSFNIHQFFQWVVSLQSFTQGYGSRRCHTTPIEAAVGIIDTGYYIHVSVAMGMKTANLYTIRLYHYWNSYRDHLATFRFSTFVMFLPTTIGLVGHETLKDGWYVVLCIIHCVFTLSLHIQSTNSKIVISHSLIVTH